MAIWRAKTVRLWLVVVLLIRLVCLSTLATLAQTAVPTRKNAAAPRNDAWTVVGPGGGGAQFIPAISPLDPNIVLVSCDMGGSYISLDGGNTWRMFNLRGRAYEFGFDPHDVATLYTRNDLGLWRSANKGNTWAMIYPDPVTVTDMAFTDDAAVPILLANKIAVSTMKAFAIDPEDSEVMYATIATAKGFTLHISRDRGKTWQPQQGADFKRSRRIYVDPRSALQTRTLYVVGDSWISVWENGTRTDNAPPLGKDSWFNDVAIAFPQDGGKAVFYAATDFEEKDGKTSGGVLISHDGGATWDYPNGGFLNWSAQGTKMPPELPAVAASLTHPEIAYLSFTKLQTGADLEQYAFGVAKTTDGGQTWKLVWSESPGRPAANIHDIWLTARFGPEWGENPKALAVHPSNPDLCFGTDDGRTMRTTDGGRTWTGVYSRAVEGGGFATTGLDVTTSYEVYFDPFDRQQMFVSYTDIGLFRSDDAGETWTSATIGVPREWRNTTYSVAFDPDVQGRMWGAMSQVHDLPRVSAFTTSNSVPGYKGGICFSDDGGRTWRKSNYGMDETAPTHILVNPASPRDTRILYVAAMGKGVYKSSDGGKNWSLKKEGMGVAMPMAWRLARDPKGTLYLVTARTSDDGSYGNDRDGVLYRSRDEGETWQRLTLPEGLSGPTDIAIDVEDPNRLYLSAWGRSKLYSIDPPQQGGIFLSTDGGQTWRNVHSADQHIYSVTVDPRNASVLYATGFESSAWRSADRGQSWTRIKGFNFRTGHRITLDPRDAGTIYVTTFGGSVWRGPAQGDSGAAEDIISPIIGYGQASMRSVQARHNQKR